MPPPKQFPNQLSDWYIYRVSTGTGNTGMILVFHLHTGYTEIILKFVITYWKKIGWNLLLGKDIFLVVCLIYKAVYDVWKVLITSDVAIVFLINNSVS